ncbi:hypothetical protein GCM10020370_29190 [Paenibacillus hodogayensis]
MEKVALNMLGKNMDMALVVELTGLPQGKVKALRKRLGKK